MVPVQPHGTQLDAADARSAPAALADPPAYSALPAYVFDKRLGRGGTGRYRQVLPDGRLGKIVSAATIAAQSAQLHDATAAQLGQLADALYAGRITPAVFEASMLQQVKNLHIANTALAYGGWRNVPPAAWARTQAAVATEAVYLKGFMDAMAAGTVTREAAVVRAGLYADNAFGAYWRERSRIMAAGGYTQEILRTQSDACPVCKDIAAQGWRPIGRLSVPVHNRCRCTIEYR